MTEQEDFELPENPEITTEATNEGDLAVAVEEQRPALTPEEAALKAAELQKKIRDIMNAQEKAMEIQNEKNRIEQGRLMQQQRELLLQVKSRQMIDQLIREKEEQQKERERQMELLKKEYKERFGIEYTEPGTNTKPMSETELKKSIAAMFGKLKVDYKDNKSVLKVCLKTLRIYLKNIVDNPLVDKYRVIKKSNNVFQSKIAPVPEVEALLDILGFKSIDESYKIEGEPKCYLLCSAIRYIDFITSEL